MAAKRPQKKSTTAKGDGTSGRSRGSGTKSGTRKGSKAPAASEKTLTRLVIAIMGVLCLVFTVMAGYWLWQGGADATRPVPPSKTERQKTPAATSPARPTPAQPSATAGNVQSGEASRTTGKGVHADAQSDASSPAVPGSTPGGDADKTAPSVPRNATSDAVDGEGAVRAPVNAGALPYEESLDAPLEEGVKQVDYALVQALVRLGIARERLRIASVETRNEQGESYHFQQMTLGVGDAPDRFVKAFVEALSVWAERAQMRKKADDLIEVYVGGVLTHEITLSLYESVEEPRPGTPVEGALLAIVIDDIGESMGAVRDLLKLDYPVTFAVWPRSSHAREAAEAAHRAGREVMIHQPMEPLKYPSVKPGPGAIYVRMGSDEIEAMLRDNLARVPHAVGLNNHMGSRFTQDVRGVRAVCEALEGKGLFVLDSVTHSGSVFYREARRAGLPAGKRNVFLDVIHDKRNIMFQLDKAARVAHEQGVAVAIGHPLAETVAALKEWQRTRDKSVRIVTMRQLLDAETTARR